MRRRHRAQQGARGTRGGDDEISPVGSFALAHQSPVYSQLVEFTYHQDKSELLEAVSRRALTKPTFIRNKRKMRHGIEQALTAHASYFRRLCRLFPVARFDIRVFMATFPFLTRLVFSTPFAFLALFDCLAP